AAIRSEDPGLAPDDPRADLLQRLGPAGVVGIVALDAIDHPVAAGGRLRPWILAAGGVDGRRVEQRLGWHARPVGAGASDQVSVDNRDAGTAPPRLVGGGLARGTGSDDHEVKRWHP